MDQELYAATRQQFADRRSAAGSHNPTRAPDSVLAVVVKSDEQRLLWRFIEDVADELVTLAVYQWPRLGYVELPDEQRAALVAAAQDSISEAWEKYCLDHPDVIHCTHQDVETARSAYVGWHRRMCMAFGSMSGRLLPAVARRMSRPPFGPYHP